MAKFITSLVLLALALAAVDATNFGRHGKFVTKRFVSAKKVVDSKEKVVFYKPMKGMETTKVVEEEAEAPTEEVIVTPITVTPEPAPEVMTAVVPEVEETPAPVVVEVEVPVVVEPTPAPEPEPTPVPEPVVFVPAPSPEGVCDKGQFFVTKVEFSGCMDCDENCAADCVDGVGCEVCKDGFFTFREDPVWPFECRSCDEFFPGCSACQQNVDLEAGPQPACLDA